MDLPARLPARDGARRRRSQSRSRRSASATRRGHEHATVGDPGARARARRSGVGPTTRSLAARRRPRHVRRSRGRARSCSTRAARASTACRTRPSGATACSTRACSSRSSGSRSSTTCWAAVLAGRADGRGAARTRAPAARRRRPRGVARARRRAPRQRLGSSTATRSTGCSAEVGGGARAHVLADSVGNQRPSDDARTRQLRGVVLDALGHARRGPGRDRAGRASSTQPVTRRSRRRRRPSVAIVAERRRRRHVRRVRRRVRTRRRHRRTQLRYLYALGTFPTEELVLRAAEHAMSDAVRPQNGPFVHPAGAAQPRARPAVWVFVRDHWDDVRGTVLGLVDPEDARRASRGSSTMRRSPTCRVPRRPPGARRHARDRAAPRTPARAPRRRRPRTRSIVGGAARSLGRREGVQCGDATRQCGDRPGPDDDPGGAKTTRSDPPGSALGRARVPPARDPGADRRQLAGVALGRDRRRRTAVRARRVVPPAGRAVPRRATATRRPTPHNPVLDSSEYLTEHLHEVPVFVIPCLLGRLSGDTLQRRGRRLLRFDPSRGVELPARAAQPGPRLGVHDAAPRVPSARRASSSASRRRSPRPRSSRSRTRSATSSSRPNGARSRRSRTGTAGSRPRDTDPVIPTP